MTLSENVDNILLLRTDDSTLSYIEKKYIDQLYGVNPPTLALSPGGGTLAQPSSGKIALPGESVDAKILATESTPLGPPGTFGERERSRDLFRLVVLSLLFILIQWIPKGTLPPQADNLTVKSVIFVVMALLVFKYI